MSHTYCIKIAQKNITKQTKYRPLLKNHVLTMFTSRDRVQMTSHLNKIFWVCEGESGKFSLVEVHYEEFVGWSQFRFFVRKLLVEVAHIPTGFLKKNNTGIKIILENQRNLMFTRGFQLVYTYRNHPCKRPRAA